MGDSAFNTLKDMKSVAPKIQSVLNSSMKPINLDVESVNKRNDLLYSFNNSGESMNYKNNDGYKNNNNIEPLNININQMNVRNDEDIVKIAQELNKLRKFEFRAKGGVFSGI